MTFGKVTFTTVPAVTPAAGMKLVTRKVPVASVAAQVALAGRVSAVESQSTELSAVTSLRFELCGFGSGSDTVRMSVLTRL